jgi:hypothetical protein
MAANRKIQLFSFTLFLFLTIVSFTAYCQAEYSAKVETGFLKYRYQLVQYDLDPGSDWKGYYLDNEQDGIDLNLVNGVSFFENRFFTGVGIGYQNFEGINGITVFGDIEYLPLKSKLTPLLNIKAGYDHIWNQYEGGTGTAFGEFAAGVSYKLTEKLNIYLKSGILFTQQSSLIPIRIGLGF